MSRTVHGPATVGAHGRRHERGVNRAELALVIGIVAVIAVIVVVAVAGIDSGVAARRCSSGERQFKAAVEQYRAENGRYPANTQALVDDGLLQSGDGPAAARDWQVAVDVNNRPVIEPSPEGRCA